MTNLQLDSPRKKERTQARNEREDISRETQRIVRDRREQLCGNKLDNLEEMNTFLETHNFPRLNTEEMKNINRMITSNYVK